MSAAALLTDMRARGAELRIDGEELRVRAPKGSITPELAERLRRHKAELMRLLKPAADWDAADWQGYYDERAGIAEHDGGMPRAKAEQMALESSLVEWQHQHPPDADPASCAFCGAPAGEIEPGAVLADGATVHHRCTDGWGGRRRGEAVSALEAMGIREVVP